MHLISVCKVTQQWVGFCKEICTLEIQNRRNNKTGYNKMRMNKDIDFKLTRRKHKSLYWNKSKSKRQSARRIDDQESEDQRLNIQTNNFFTSNEDDSRPHNASPIVGSIANSVIENALHDSLNIRKADDFKTGKK